MPHAALWVVQPHRSQPLSPYGEKALLESLRKFEMSDGKYVKYLFLFSFSLRRNPLRDQHLMSKWKVSTVLCGFAAHPHDFPFRSLHRLYHSRDYAK